FAQGPLRGAARQAGRVYRLYRRQTEPDRAAKAALGQAQRIDAIGWRQGTPALRQAAGRSGFAGTGDDPRPHEPTRAVPPGEATGDATDPPGARSPLQCADARAAGGGRSPLPTVA